MNVFLFLMTESVPNLSVDKRKIFTKCELFEKYENKIWAVQMSELLILAYRAIFYHTGVLIGKLIHIFVIHETFQKINKFEK